MTRRTFAASSGLLAIALALAACEPATVTEARDQLGRGAARTVTLAVPISRDTFVASDFLSASDTVTTPGGLLGAKLPAESLASAIGQQLAFNNLTFQTFQFSYVELLVAAPDSGVVNARFAPPAAGPVPGLQLAPPTFQLDTLRFATPAGSRVAVASVGSGSVDARIVNGTACAATVTQTLTDSGGATVLAFPATLVAAGATVTVPASAAGLSFRGYLALAAPTVTPSGACVPAVGQTVAVHVVTTALALTSVTLRNVTETFSQTYGPLVGETRLTAVDTIVVASGSIVFTVRNRLPLAANLTVTLNGVTRGGTTVTTPVAIAAAAGDGSYRTTTATLNLAGATIRAGAVTAVVAGTVTAASATITTALATNAEVVDGVSNLVVQSAAGRLDPTLTPELTVAVEEYEEVLKSQVDFGDLQEALQSARINDATGAFTIRNTAQTPLALANVTLGVVRLTGAGALQRDAQGHPAYERDSTTNLPILVTLAPPGQTRLAVPRAGSATSQRPDGAAGGPAGPPAAERRPLRRGRRRDRRRRRRHGEPDHPERQRVGEAPGDRRDGHLPPRQRHRLHAHRAHRRRRPRQRGPGQRGGPPGQRRGRQRRGERDPVRDDGGPRRRRRRHVAERRQRVHAARARHLRAVRRRGLPRGRRGPGDDPRRQLAVGPAERQRHPAAAGPEVHDRHPHPAAAAAGRHRPRGPPHHRPAPGEGARDDRAERGRWPVSRALAVAAALALAAAGRLAGQEPTPPPRDTARADSVRADSAARDTTVADSAAARPDSAGAVPDSRFAYRPWHVGVLPAYRRTPYLGFDPFRYVLVPHWGVVIAAGANGTNNSLNASDIGALLLLGRRDSLRAENVVDALGLVPPGKGLLGLVQGGTTIHVGGPFGRRLALGFTGEGRAYSSFRVDDNAVALLRDGNASRQDFSLGTTGGAALGTAEAGVHAVLRFGATSEDDPGLRIIAGAGVRYLRPLAYARGGSAIANGGTIRVTGDSVAAHVSVQSQFTVASQHDPLDVKGSGLAADLLVRLELPRPGVAVEMMLANVGSVRIQGVERRLGTFTVATTNLREVQDSLDNAEFVVQDTTAVTVTLPRVFRLAASAWLLPMLQVDASYTAAVSGDFAAPAVLEAGATFRLLRWFPLRLGVVRAGDYGSGLTGGFGIETRAFYLDVTGGMYGSAPKTARGGGGRIELGIFF